MRIRTVKPEFWQNEELAACSPETRLLAIGLLNHADDEGYFKAHPALVKAAIFPFSDDALNVGGLLAELSTVGYIRLGTGSDGHAYGHITRFTAHQRVNRPNPSKIKDACDFSESSVKTQCGVTAGMEQGTGKGKNMCPEPKSSAAGPKKPNIEFDFETGKFVNVDSERDIAHWDEAYPATDVSREIKAAADWLMSNPTKKKKNYRRFLSNWLSRAQEHGGGRRHPRGPDANAARGKVVT